MLVKSAGYPLSKGRSTSPAVYEKQSVLLVEQGQSLAANEQEPIQELLVPAICFEVNSDTTVALKVGDV
jgi:hypothetical protein